MKKGSFKDKIIIVIGVIALLSAMIGVTYARFVADINNGNFDKIQTGTISMNYTEDSNAISISDMTPLTDNTGKQLNDYFDFTVSTSATGNTEVGYTIYLEDSGSLNRAYVKVYLTEVATVNNVETESVVVAPTTIEDLNNFQVGLTTYGPLLFASSFDLTGAIKTRTKNYRLRMWLDGSYTANQTETFSTSVNIYATDI